MEGFNISSNENYVNKDILVTYTPNSSVIKYQYFIYKNDNIVEQAVINENKKTDFILNETGSYKIKINTVDINNEQKIIDSGVYNIDKIAPVIELDEKVVNMEIGDTLKPLEGVKVTDNIDGNLINRVTTNINELDLNNPGVKTLTYKVVDSAGNVAESDLTVNVNVANANTLFVVQFSIIIVLAIFATLIIFYRRSMQLEKRIAKYSVEPLHDNGEALFDSYWNFYLKIVNRISKRLEKFNLIKKYSEHYDKYVGILNKTYHSGLDFVSSKFLVSIIFVLIAIFSKTIQYEILSIYEVSFPLLVGFFMPDIVYIYKYKLHRNKIENDLLQAIIVMNNAFKSGRSITQAIDLVTTELEGAIADEFKKMHMELSFGLSVDVVFKRFSKRVKLEEVNYLTASISILNKTGGNIIKVFSSIEKSLFDRKRLKLEMASLTGSSKLIMYVLFLVPILFVIFVSIINPNYFKAFYTTTLGGIILSVIIIMYIIYILLIRKIMKVRM